MRIRPLRAVFDCNIFLQAATGSTGPSFACLRAAEAGFVQLIISSSVIEELQDVLTRDKMRKKFPVFIESLVDSFISYIVSIAATEKKVSRVFSYSRDAKDELYIDLAIASKANYIVSRDKDLLDLMDNSILEGVGFRRDFPDIAIVTPVELLTILRKGTG